MSQKEIERAARAVAEILWDSTLFADYRAAMSARLQEARRMRERDEALDQEAKQWKRKAN